MKMVVYQNVNKNRQQFKTLFQIYLAKNDNVFEGLDFKLNSK